MKFQYLLLFLILSSISILSFSQSDSISVRSRGILYSDGFLEYDGGMGNLNIVDVKYRIRGNKLKLKAKLVDKISNEDIPYYNIYVGVLDTLPNRLYISDTLMNFVSPDEYEDIKPFKFKAELTDEQNIYISTVGYGVLEISIVKD